MIFSYFKGYKNRTRMEEALGDMSSVEPNEINEVRFSTIGKSKSKFMSKM